MEPLIVIAAVLVAVLGVGRLARIVIYDAFPPSVWLRTKWDDLTYSKAKNDYNSWNKLLHCPWCLVPWIMLIAIGWFLLGLEYEWAAWAWWLFWGWLALSYVSTMIYVRDEPRS